MFRLYHESPDNTLCIVRGLLLCKKINIKKYCISIQHIIKYNELCCIFGGLMNNVDVIKDKNDIEKIKNILIIGDYRNYLMFIIGINTGLRITQILSLKFSDLIDNEDNVISKIDFNGIEYRINDCIKDALRNYICVSGVENKNTFIFKSKKGSNPIERTQAYRILKNACREAGVNLNFGTHTLRKTFGYHFYKEYKDLKYLQKLFNHSSIKITMEYIGIERKSDEIKYSSFNL